MASNAQNPPTSPLSTTPMPTASYGEVEGEQRPQAGPLPSKAGEIGYVPPESNETNGETMVEVSLGPHPAERNNTPTSPQSNSSAASTSQTQQTQTQTQTQTSSAHSTRSTKKALLKFLHAEQPIKRLGGVRVSTLVRLVVTLLTLSGTAVGWALIIVRMSRTGNQDSDTTLPDSGNGNATDRALSAFIFVHVAFGIGTIFQLLLLERAVFLARAERYNYLHPERATDPNSIEGFRSLAPWARPPLPTYASALGFRGTGDVEDAIISAPPPPAYGNTRGSTLLLTAALRNSLIERNTEDAIRNGSRCVSYMSTCSRTECERRCTDEERCLRTQADRARRIEEALVRLENGRHRQTPEPSPPSPAVLRG